MTLLHPDELPYLTADVPGLGGRIKARPEDFAVEEVPLYPPCGEGTHVYFRIEKVGLPTMQAVHQVARALGVAARDIGYAGLKDANAVTTQTLSLEHVDPARIAALDLRGIRVREVSRHGNKLKLGHLAGNRFAVKVRDCDPDRRPEVESAMRTLANRGVPNYFGPQRFGMRGDTWQIGLALLHGDYASAMAQMLGRPAPCDHGEILRARQLYDAGDYHAAADAWPYNFANERRACRALAQARGNARKGFRAVDLNLQRLYLSAFQSHLFNQAVARRLDHLDVLWLGDLAWRHPQGAVFEVQDVDREQPRCEAFEVSPTGPLFGQRMRAPVGRQGELEAALLAEADVSPEQWGSVRQRVASGARRPLRFQPQEWSVDAGRDGHGPYVLLRFRLESGCYATTLLREICKCPSVVAGQESTEVES